MSIRIAKIEDVSQISELVKSLSHFYLNDQSAELPHWFLQTLTDESFLSRVKSDEYYNFVYVMDSEVVGYIAFRGESHLFHLFVAEKHQGKGISRQLWEYAIVKCKAEKYTLRSSLFAVPIYQKLGFKITTEVGNKEGIAFQPMEFSAL